MGSVSMVEVEMWENSSPEVLEGVVNAGVGSCLIATSSTQRCQGVGMCNRNATRVQYRKGFSLHKGRNTSTFLSFCLMDTTVAIG
jgi:hypothetical protein